MIPLFFSLIASTSWAIQPVPIRPAQRAPQGTESWNNELIQRVQSNFMQFGTAIQLVDLRDGGTVYGIIYIPTIHGPLTVAGSSTTFIQAVKISSSANILGSVFITGTEAGIRIDKDAGTPAIDLMRDSTLRGRIQADTQYLYLDGATNGVRVRDDGGTVRAEANNSGFAIGATGTPLAVVSTKTATVTVSLTSNIASTATATANFMRVGSMVHFSVLWNMATSGTGASEAQFTLPAGYTSAITVEADASGACANNTNNDSGRLAGAGTNLLRIYFNSATTAAKDWACSGLYVIK